ncbi:MAG: nitrous oxide-stimulated promoter family protein [Ruminococcaceae bacterium]|nr:nitrous oxide-stimulated promoter family protein [Oscillospiraceae bacterium]
MKILLVSVLIILTAFVIIAMYCSFVIAARFDKQLHEGIKNHHYTKNSLCPQCKTGKESYILDSQSENCPYLEYYNNEGCLYFISIKSSSNEK